MNDANRTTIVVTLDRLHRGFVGAYGNAVAETPTLDELACRSLVADRFYVRTLDHHRTLQEWAALLKSSGRTTTLVTDDAHVAALLRSTLTTTHLHSFTPPIPDDSLPTDPGDTHAARFFDDVVRVAERMIASGEPSILWCHYGGLGLVWDAPMEWRLRYCDEGDLEPYASMLPPPLCPLRRGVDDDAIQSVHAAYAANVAILDEWLGGFFQFWESLTSGAWDDTLLLVAATRGIPLGQHGLLGVCDPSHATSRDEEESHLWSETIHVPLWVRPPGTRSGRRLGSLVTLDDLKPIVDGETQSLEPRATRIEITSPRVAAMVTEEWFLRTELHQKSNPDESNVPRHQLFAKPADRWEVNDVANRCSDVLETLGITALGLRRE